MISEVWWRRPIGVRAGAFLFCFFVLSACNEPTVQVALRQRTETSVEAPSLASFGEEDQPSENSGRRGAPSGPEAEAKPEFDALAAVPLHTFVRPRWRAISNSELSQWQMQQASVFKDQDPNLRPQQMPRPFAQSNWNNYLPFFPAATRAT